MESINDYVNGAALLNNNVFGECGWLDASSTSSVIYADGIASDFVDGTAAGSTLGDNCETLNQLSAEFLTRC